LAAGGSRRKLARGQGKKKLGLGRAIEGISSLGAKGLKWAKGKKRLIEGRNLHKRARKYSGGRLAEELTGSREQNKSIMKGRDYEKEDLKKKKGDILREKPRGDVQVRDLP